MPSTMARESCSATDTFKESGVVPSSTVFSTSLVHAVNAAHVVNKRERKVPFANEVTGFLNFTPPPKNVYINLSFL